MLFFKTDAEFFFIMNKAYKHAKLAQWGTADRDIGTHEQKEHPGYYSICNVKNNGYRIGKWGGDDQTVGNYSGQYFDEQLWKFEKYGDFYRIFNYKYEDAKIAKWGKAIVIGVRSMASSLMINCGNLLRSSSHH